MNSDGTGQVEQRSRLVIPAQAGIQEPAISRILGEPLEPGVRRDDEPSLKVRVEIY